MGEISDALARAREAEKSKRPAEPRENPRPSEARERPYSALMREASDAPPAREEPTAPRVPTPAPTPAEEATQPAAEVAESTLEAEASPATAASSSRDELRAPELQAKVKKRHIISKSRAEGWIGRICAVEPDADAAVRFRHLAVRMRSMLDNRRKPSLLVTSSISGEGKTTVSCNLAIALASIAPECRVALIDLDLHRGRVSNVMDYSGKIGIEDVLRGDVSLSDACVETEFPALDFYPVWHPVQDAHGLLGGAAERTLQNIHARYDYVICDGPPVLPVPDVPLIAPHVGGCMVVAASGRSRHRAFRETLSLIPRGMTLGIFLNENPGAIRSRNYRYYYGMEDEEAGGGRKSKDDDAFEEANS